MNYLLVLLVNLVFYVFVFTIGKVKHKHSVVDIFWGTSFIVQTIAAMIIGANFSMYNLLIVFVVMLWGVRLTIHLFMRNWSVKEDYRYEKIVLKLRERLVFIPLFLKEFAYIYMLQALLSFFIAQAFISFLLRENDQINFLFIIGIIIFITGYLFEVIGDYQLRNFTFSNKSPVLKTGLWRYTRHPNYFGEVTIWWGIFIATLKIDYFYISIIGPLVITILILRISGIPLLEKELVKNEAYRDYMKVTSKFLPLPRKKVKK